MAQDLMTNTANYPQKPERLLAEVGIHPDEEQAYRIMLARDSVTALELSVALAIPREQAQRLLESLQAKGLATRITGELPRYASTPPEVAIETLILRQQAGLQRVRHSIRLLR